MLPPIYQQQQQQNEFNCGTNNQMCSMMMQTSSDCLKSTSVQNMSPPFRDFPAQLNTSGKSSQLKETHSALVKILESAPIPSNTSTTSATTMTVPPFTKSTTILLSSLPQSQPPKSSSSSTTLTSFSTTTTSATATMVAVSAAPTMLLVNQTNQQNTYHRKRNKHLNTISTHCDMDKSSDEEVGCNSNSSASSNASEAEIICPWKKTRIAREWHQSQKMDENLMEHRPPTIVNVPTINLNIQSNNNDGEYDAGDDISDDNGENDENASLCECYNTWRRASNDGDDDDELHENIGASTKKHKSFHSGQNNGGTDSGCDSDCPENISELCKKFDENLSEQDGFFRRSIQQKIQYRPCTKNQQCSILRINRNRCQYCRLKKCIAVGMSRDAVRFGRVPKREKARILAAMQQSTQNRGHQRAMATELDDQPRLLAAVLRAHMETCEFTREKVASMRQRARECPSYSLPTMACPLNPAPELQSEQEFSQRFAHVIRGVIDFAGMIPGFQLLTQDDKFTLLKAGLFDALFVRLICMFDTSINSIICLNGQVMRRNSIQNGANARFLVDSTFNFAERMNAMNLSDSEIGLFCAIVLISADRPGLRNIELVEKMHSRLKGCLQTVISQNRPDDPDFMMELLKLLPDLRTLSTLHTEKLVVFRTEHKEMLRQQMWSMEEESSKSSGLSPWGCNDQVIEEVTKSPMGSVSSTESGDTASDYSQSLSQSAPLLAATLAGGCPMRLRANSGSSAEDDIVGTHHLTQNGLTITPVVRSTTAAHHIRYRKLDSPTDSGIESGNEKADHKAASSESSSCSSPRSSVDDMNEEKRPIAEDMPVLKRVLQAPPLYDTNSLMDEAYKPHKKFRALRHREYEAEADSVHHSTHNQQQQSTTQQQQQQQQQQHSSEPPQSQTISEKPTLSPPQTNPHQSQLHMHLTRPNSHQHSSSAPTHHHHQQHHHQSSLSSTHSVLARSLMEEPRMTPEQMKRSDIITSYIKRESQVEQQQRVSSQGGLLVCALSSGSNSHRSSPLNASAMPPKQCPYTGASTNRWQNGTTLSVITTTRHNTEPAPIREDMIQDGVDVRLKNDVSSPTSSSPHSTSSTSPAMPNSTASMDEEDNPMLRSTMVSLLQPLNLSKKSPSPVQHQLSSCF